MSDSANDPVTSQCKTLEEAREKILKELPPKPNFANLGTFGVVEFNAMEAAMNWLLDANFIYKSAVFGLAPEASEI